MRITRILTAVLIAAGVFLAAAPVASAADVVVTPAAPTVNQAPCGSTEGSIDIPTVTGVLYALDTIPGPGGEYLADLGPHSVQAVPQPGYTFPSGYPPVVEWTLTVTQQGNCSDIPIVAPPPVWHQATCTSGGFGSVDIPVSPHLAYNLDGTWPPQGSTQLLSTYPSPHEVMVAAFDGYVLVGGPVIRWDFTVVVPTNCKPGHRHHYGWCQPRNPHHVTCVRRLPPSTNPPPHIIDWAGRHPAFTG